MKTVKEIAQMLDGQEYGSRFPPQQAVDQAVESGVVICYGASDDLFEVDGAIRDEQDGPKTVYFEPDGSDVFQKACKDEECPHEGKRKSQCPKVKLRWHDKGNPCWTLETTIPHEKFRVMEDGEVFCEGIVFSVEDLKKAPRT